MSDTPGRAIYPVTGQAAELPDIKAMTWPNMGPLASRIADHIYAESQAHGGIDPDRYEVDRAVWNRLNTEMGPVMNPGYLYICGVQVVAHG
jgi:hypothetical protein